MCSSIKQGIKKK